MIVLVVAIGYIVDDHCLNVSFHKMVVADRIICEVWLISLELSIFASCVFVDILSLKKNWTVYNLSNWNYKTNPATFYWITCTTAREWMVFLYDFGLWSVRWIFCLDIFPIKNMFEDTKWVIRSRTSMFKQFLT